jgi:hypothetical protein
LARFDRQNCAAAILSCLRAISCFGVNSVADRRRESAKVGLIFARASAMVDCAAQ